MSLHQAKNCYLMGIKGVAMTSLAQILLDDDKQVAGCDVAEEFVTQPLLDKLQIQVDHGFAHSLPQETNCLIYTSAHGGPKNPSVLQAKERGISSYSQAEALAHYFNQKRGIAVCGVGGKTTVSAMITWIMQRLNLNPSFSVGVGEIIGMNRTGQWQQDSTHFIAEADEYVIDPAYKENHTEMQPRFSFLQPNLTICTNLAYDHPDVYNSIQHTQQVFLNFFEQIEDGGGLIYNADSLDLQPIIKALNKKNKGLKFISFGQTEAAQACLISSSVEERRNIGKVQYQGRNYQLQLAIPGKFNLLNALAACLAVEQTGQANFQQTLEAISRFKGTQRRFEFKGEKGGVLYYDDYAHHPNEIKKTIQALVAWHPENRKVITFQPHTFSRTKQLFNEFVRALGTAQEALLLDIFPSARENFDSSISSDLLVESIRQQYPQMKVLNLGNIEALASYCREQLKPGDILLTMGAGDIYKVHNNISWGSCF